jgi:phenylpropionate dioxygenase-like ring-hydroxylating dioxygenase large terminal subunit
MNYIAKPEVALLGEPCRDEVLLNQWHVVAYSHELVAEKLLPITLLERDLVAWRDRDGVAHVWEDLCVHRGARLSKGFIQDNTVVCPYHGWRYDGTATCVFMPAEPQEKPMKKARTIPHQTQEKYGFIWVCLGAPLNDIPEFAEWDDPSYQKIHCGPYRFRSGYRALDNFVDPTHFPFVHAGVNGVFEEPDPIAPYEVFEDQNGLTSTEVKVTQPYGDPRGVPVISYYSYKIMRPLVAPSASTKATRTIDSARILRRNRSITRRASCEFAAEPISRRNPPRTKCVNGKISSTPKTARSSIRRGLREFPPTCAMNCTTAAI